MTKVVITGVGGYIGTQLAKKLLDSGHNVLGIDRFFFGLKPIENFVGHKNFKILKKDIRDLEAKDLMGYDVVCDLACLSNDPSGEINPQLTYEINRDGRIHVARVSKDSGIQKYILSSSCSVYGGGENSELLDENSKTNPISTYAQSTLEAEIETLNMNSPEFSVTALRNSTVFGISDRMRFDLVVNLMTLSAFEKNRIIIMGGGLQWRPLIHVSDVALAFEKVIDSELDLINGEIFNVGYKNFQVRGLAYIVRDKISNTINIEIAPDDNDKRNYKVNFEKFEKKIGFKAQVDVETGVEEIFRGLKSGRIESDKRTNTVQWYKSILEAHKLIDEISLNGRII